MYQVLLVEHNEEARARAMACRMWRQGRYQVADTAANGKEALEKLAAGRYDIVITEAQMPVMGGLELCRQIHANGYPSAVILAGQQNDFYCAREGMRMGAVDYIEKPYSEEKLAEALFFAERSLRVPEEEQGIRLYHELLEGDQGSVAIAASLWEECLKEQGDRREEARESLRAVLEQVYEQIALEAPWVRVLDPLQLQLGECPKKDVERQLQEFRCLMERYRLSQPDPVVKRIAGIIEQNVGRENIQDYLAQQLDLSKDYMSRLVRRRLGVTLSDYCMRLRMERAKSMLRGTGKKVYEISEELGYSTVDYFTRLFKQYTGSTPAGYRKSG